MPRICLKEKMRGMGNKYATRWGKKIEKAFQEVGDGLGIREL